MADESEDYNPTLKELLLGAPIPEAERERITEIGKAFAEKLMESRPQRFAHAGVATVTVEVFAAATGVVLPTPQANMPLHQSDPVQQVIAFSGIYTLVEAALGEDVRRTAGSAAVTVLFLITLWLINELRRPQD
jgi:hypothetical protein